MVEPRTDGRCVSTTRHSGEDAAAPAVPTPKRLNEQCATSHVPSIDTSGSISALGSCLFPGVAMTQKRKAVTGVCLDFASRKGFIWCT